MTPPRPRLRNVADVLTLGNAVAGFLAIVTFSLETGILPQYSNALVATLYIGVGLVLDSLDGPAARRWGSSEMGPALDTLSDLITFVVAPAVFVLEVYGPVMWPGAVAASLAFLVTGTLRLARFTRAAAESGKHTFRGLPTPWAAICVAVLVVLGAPPTLALPAVGLLAGLMVSDVAYPKSRRRARYGTLAIAVAATALIAGLLLLPTHKTAILAAALVIAVVTITAAPFLAGLAEAPSGSDEAD
jgi:CDP-diacylglycerol--serine O-phosphatidyltransferase